MRDARLTITTSRRLWWGLVVLLVLLWCLGALLPQVVADLESPPAVTTVLLPVVRFVRDAAAAVTVGCLLVGGLLVRGCSARVLRWTIPWALLWLVSLAAFALLTLSDVLAISPVAALDPTTLWSFLTDVTLGRVVLWQGVGVLLVLGLSQAVISRPTAWVVLGIACVAAAAPSLVGHGGLSGGHLGATISLALHLVAMSLWLGGLVAVVAYALTDRTHAGEVVARFGVVALVAAVVLAESGLLNASMRVATSSWLTSDYTALVVAKAALLLWLVRLAWRQRTRVLPSLAGADDVSVAALARLAGWEVAAMGAAAAVGVAMSRVGPDSAAGTPYLVNPLLLALLAVVVPELIGRTWHLQDRHGRVHALARYPEQASIVLALVAVVVAGLGAPSALLGPQLGALVAGAALLAAGTLQAVAISSSGRSSAVITAMALWALVVVVVTALAWTRTTGGVDLRLPLAGLALAEGVLATRLVRPARRWQPAEEPALEGAVA